MSGAIISHNDKTYLKQCSSLSIQQVEEILKDNSFKDEKVFFLFKICSLNKEAIGNFDFNRNEISFTILKQNVSLKSFIRKCGPNLIPHFPFENYKYTLLRVLTKD